MLLGSIHIIKSLIHIIKRNNFSLYGLYVIIWALLELSQIKLLKH